jgi:flagellin-specific chaperone FliS
MELAAALDYGRGGEISRRLGLLYEYIGQRLIEANLRQSDAILAEVLGLLATLSEGWEAIARKEQTAPCAVDLWARSGGAELAREAGRITWA